MTLSPSLPRRYIAAPSPRSDAVEVMDTATDAIVMVVFQHAPQPAQALAQQVADLLNLGEAERQRTEQLKDDLLQHYSRWLEGLSFQELAEAHVAARLPFDP